MNRPIHRFMLLVGAAALLSLFTFACGGNSEDTDKPSPPRSGVEQAAPADQQKLVVHGGEPMFLDPQLSRTGQDIAIERMLFRGLYRIVLTEDGDLETQPALADGEPEVDGNVYTIRLKAGLQWSDGRVLTAADFEYSLKRGCSPDTMAPYQYLLGMGALNIVGCDEYLMTMGKSPEEQAAQRDKVGVKALDATTLEVTVAAPKALFTTYMSLWPTYPLRQDIIEQYGEAWTAPENIVGNGPFVLSEYAPKDHITLTPNQYWSLTPKPQLQEITIKFIDDTAAAMRAFQTGELAVAQVPPVALADLEADPSLASEVIQVPSPRLWFINLQLGNEALSDENVRLALSRAIDRETLVNVIYAGAYSPATYWVVEGLPGYQGDKFDSIIGYDPEAAKAALAEAGYPDGQGLPTLKLTVVDRPDRKAEAEFLAKAWKDVLGIQVEIEAVDSRSMGQIFGTGQFDLLPGGWQNDYPDPESSLIGNFDTGGMNNLRGCSDPEIDSKLQAAAAEEDNSKRISLLQDAEDLVIGTLCGVIPLYQPSFVFLVSDGIGGIEPSGGIDASLPGDWCPECWFVKADE